MPADLTRAPVAPDWPTRCAALEADGIAARKRVAALEAENAKLRRELEPLAREAERYDPPSESRNEDLLDAWDSRFLIGHLRRARALLQGGPDAG